MLESVRDLVSEMIVVDTGSEDSTPELARKQGARVIQFPWNNDFAAARNVSIAEARYPWILVLDADEAVSEESLGEIRKLITGEVKAYSLDRHHYCDSFEFVGSQDLPVDHCARSRGAVSYFVTHDVRLFPNHPRVRYTGAVHESVEDSLWPAGFRTSRAQVVIHHFGPLGDRDRAALKGEQYLALAREKVSANPLDWRTWLHLGVELQNRSRNDEAVEVLRKSTDLYPSHATTWRQLAISLCITGAYAEGLQAFTKAFELNGSCIVTWNALGVVFMQLGRLEDAELCFSTILQHEPNNRVAQKNFEMVKSHRSHVR